MRYKDLLEGPLSPIPVTPRFIGVHGNYCGPGNKGGDPVDALDAACQRHDVGYHYTPDPVKRLKHDAAFRRAASQIAADKSHPLTTRIKARTMADVFDNKLKTVSAARNQMLFKEASNPHWDPVVDMTHEVLTSHGATRTDEHGWDDKKKPEWHSMDPKPEAHDSIIGMGWEHKASHGPDTAGWKLDVYGHPDLGVKLLHHQNAAGHARTASIFRIASF